MENQEYRRLIGNLRNAIAESGLKQKVIAERCGKDTKKLSNILCLRQRLAVEDVTKLCTVLNISPNRLFFGSDSRD